MKFVFVSFFTFMCCCSQLRASSIDSSFLHDPAPRLSKHVMETDVKRSWDLANNYYNLSCRSEFDEERKRERYKTCIEYLENYIRKNLADLKPKRLKKIASIYENKPEKTVHFHGDYLWAQSASYWHSYILSHRKKRILKTPQMVDAYKHAAFTNQHASLSSSLLFPQTEKQKRKLSKRAASYWSNVANDITSPEEKEFAIYAIYGLQHAIKEDFHPEKETKYQEMIDALKQRYNIGLAYALGDSVYESQPIILTSVPLP